MIAAIWAWSPLVRAISVRKRHPKPWQMTTRDGLGVVSDHSRSIAMTAGSTLSATADPPAISNATSTVAKRRTTTSPDEPPSEFTRRSTPRKAQPAASEALRGTLWESVTYLPASRTRKRRQFRDDGNN